MKQPQTQLQPYAPDIEQAVLGAIILEKGAYGLIKNVLFADIFFEQKHRVLYEILLRLIDQDSEIDLLIVANEAKKTGSVELIGGIPYLATLTDRVVSAAHIERHALILKEKWVNRGLIALSHKLSDYAYEDRDAFRNIDYVGNELRRISETATGSISSTADDLLSDYLQTIDKTVSDYAAGKRDVAGLPFIWPEFVKYHPAGLEKGKLIVVGAAPSVGKSAWAANLARVHGGMYFTFEMPKKELMHRLMSMSSMINGVRIKTGCLSLEDILTISQTKPTLKPLHLCEGRRMTVDKIRLKVAEVRNPSFIVIDSIQRTGRNPRLKSDEAIAEIVQECKAMAIEFDVPIMLLSSFSKQKQAKGETGEPVLGDLMGSQAIESDADIVILMRRDGDREINGHKYDRVLFDFAKTRDSRRTSLNDQPHPLYLDGSIFTFFDMGQAYDRPENFAD